MSRVLSRDETTGDGRTVLPQKDEQEKAQGLALISARKPCELAHELAFKEKLAKTRLDQGTGLINPVPPPPPTAADCSRCWALYLTPGAIGRPVGG